jgi:hypothetical protein
MHAYLKVLFVDSFCAVVSCLCNALAHVRQAHHISPVATKNSSENGGTHGAQSLFVKSPVVSENVSTCVSQTPLANLVCLQMQK